MLRSEHLDFTQRIMADAMRTSSAPDGHAVMMLDMSGVHAFRARYLEKHGIALTDLQVVIRALAYILEREPYLQAIIRGNRIVFPDSVDIGVSVATGRSITPIIVIENAQSKTLRDIHRELRDKSAQIVASEKAAKSSGGAKWHSYAKWVPGSVRRAIIGGLGKSAKIRRSKVGTFQITSVDLSDLEFYMPYHMGTTTLMSIGGTKLRAVVVDGEIEIRPTVYVSFGVDQRVVGVVRSLKSFRRFKRLLENPAKLMD